MPSRMRLSNNELILTDACKNCDDRISDLQVIQCNASNVHGYQFVDAYINVLRKYCLTAVALLLSISCSHFVYLLHTDYIW